MKKRLPGPGGPWEYLDPVAQGRVQLLHVADAAHQTIAVVGELTPEPSLELARLRRVGQDT